MATPKESQKTVKNHENLKSLESIDVALEIMWQKCVLPSLCPQVSVPVEWKSLLKVTVEHRS